MDSGVGTAQKVQVAGASHQGRCAPQRRAGPRAAREVFAEMGADASLEEIARRAGVVSARSIGTSRPAAHSSKRCFATWSMLRRRADSNYSRRMIPLTHWCAFSASRCVSRQRVAVSLPKQ